MIAGNKFFIEKDVMAVVDVDDVSDCRTIAELQRHDVIQFWVEGVTQVSF